MGLYLLERAVTQLKTYLEGAIAAKLNVLDAEYADFALNDIKQWYIGNIPRDQPEFPSVCLQGASIRPEERTADKLYSKLFINILVFVGDDNDQTRFKKLCRYARAIIELLPEGESTYGYIHWLEGDIIISDTLNAAPFLQAVMIPISLYPPSGESY